MPENSLNPLLDNNIKALQEYHNIVIEDSDINATSDYIMEHSKSGHKTLKYHKDNKTIYIVSKYNPYEEAERFVSEINLLRRNYYIIFGLGAGYILRALAGKLKNNSQIFVFEPSKDIFLENIKHFNMTEIIENPNIKFFFFESYLDFFNTMLSLNSWEKVGNVRWITHPNYDILFSETYKNFLKAYKDFYNSIAIDRNTFQYYAEEWTNEGFKNMVHFIDSTNFVSFENAFKDIPSVVVSAGPSLNKNVHFLKEVKGKLPIVCVYTAYKPLKKLGIVPDFIVSVDVYQLIKENEEEIKTKVYSEFLLTVMSTDRRLLDKHVGDKSTMIVGADMVAPSFYMYLEKPVKSIEIGGSVACSAVSFAKFIGSSTIIFIGQDLAYTNDKTHADGTFYDGDNQLNKNADYIYIEDIDGGKVPTDAVFYDYKIWFDTFVQNNEQIRFVDATEGGAKIYGTEIMTFRDIIDELKVDKFDISEKIEDLKKNSKLFSKKDKRFILKVFKSAKDFMKARQTDLGRAIRICKEVIEIIETGQDKKRKAFIERQFEKLDNTDKKINKMSEFFFFTEMLFQLAYYELENYDNESKLSDDLYFMHRNLLIYDRLDVIFKKLVPQLEAVIPELEEKINGVKKES